MFPSFHQLIVVATVLVAASWQCRAAELRVGAASVSITPKEPVALSGQMHTRVARNVESEVTATALALESRTGEQALDQAILVACDLVAIRKGILEKVRSRLQDQIRDFNLNKLVLSATHTHTAPVTEEGAYELPADGIIRPADYIELLADRVAEAAASAWKSRQPASASWGLGHAVLGQNRRSVYADGRAQMYGRTNLPDFRSIEGPEDHGVEVLFFWDQKRKLLATAVNVACPAQEVEGRSAVNADFWHQVRTSLQAKYGKELRVLAWTGAAGDQSPHLMYRKDAEERMRKLRGVDRLEELARRIVAAWEEAYEGARQDMHADVPLVHKVETLELPVRQVSPAEFAQAKLQVETLSNDPRNRRRMLWEQDVVDRYQQQQAGETKPYAMELHVIRLGDIAIATNSFELFTDYGIQMKARSKALQTFVIQLAGPGTYLPTERAVRGGGYSAIVESSLVGPEGGQMLAERTIETINSLWPSQ